MNPGQEPRHKPLSRAVLRGSAWLVINTGATKGLSLLAQALLAAALSDKDFGVYAIAISLSMFASILKDGGVRQLLIQRHSEHEILLGPVFWMAGAFNLLTGAAMAVAGPVAARLYEEPALAPMLWIIALSVPLSTPGAVLAARLNTEMRFRELAAAQVASAVVRYGGSVALAYGGAGPLSFVLPLPVIALVEWAFLYRANPERLWSRAPHPELWPGLLSQSVWVLLGSFATGLINMGNYVVVGLFVGKPIVGTYFFAYQIVTQVATLVNANINQVLFPALTRMAGDVDRQSRAVSRSIRQLMLLAAPLGTGLIPTFQPLERLIWNGKWAAAVPSVCIIAALYPATVIHAVPYAALQARGAFRRWALLLSLQALGMMAAGALAARTLGSPEAISLASGAFMFASTLAFAAVGLRGCGLDTGAVVRAAIPAWLLGLAAAAGAFWLVATLLLHPALEFLIGGCAFVALYGALARFLLPNHIREALLIVPAVVRPVVSGALRLRNVPADEEPAPPRPHPFMRPLCALFTLASAAALAITLVGLTLSDRYAWSQFPAWIPEEAALLVSGVCLLLAGLAAALARGQGPPPARLSRAACAAILAVLGAHLLLVHWRLPNLLARPGPGATPNAFRILAWNITAVERTEQINDPLARTRPDLAVLVNPHSRVGWQQVIADFGAPTGLIWQDGIVVLSHAPIIRHGSLWLGINGAPAPARGQRPPADPGRAMFVELDTTERLGRITILWILDLPSDWRLSRWDLAGQAAAAIAAWPGPEFVHDPAGRTVQRPVDAMGFPTPDIILGDFNTPRGSASLARLAPGMANAFDQGGAGPAATWPGQRMGRAPFPIFHLDQMFLAPPLRAARYSIDRPAFGYHWPQVAEVVSDGKGVAKGQNGNVIKPPDPPPAGP